MAGFVARWPCLDTTSLHEPAWPGASQVRGIYLRTRVACRKPGPRHLSQAAVAVARTAPAGLVPLDDLGEPDDGHDVVRADLAPVDLLEEVNRLLRAPEFGVVVLDVTRGELPDPLYLDVVDHRREHLLARLVPESHRDPDELPAPVFHALVAEPDRRGLAAELELVDEDRGIEVQDVQGRGDPGAMVGREYTAD